MEWISVTDRLPEVETWVLVYVPTGYDSPVVIVGQRFVNDHEYQWWEDWDADDVKPTHWMPLPEPPKESE